MRSYMFAPAFHCGSMVYVEIVALTFGRARIIQTDGLAVFAFW